MKKFFAAITFLVLATFSFAQKAGDEITFSATDLDGNPITSEIFSDNKVTMLNIWGTFCGPCIGEMPDLAELNEENAEKGFEVVGIIIDIIDNNGNIDPEIKAEAEKIIRETGAYYTHIVPDDEMNDGLLGDIQAVPTTIFVDSKGKQIGKIYLGSKSKKEWQKIINKLLK